MTAQASDLLVFSQQPSRSIDVQALDAQARRFFAASVSSGQSGCLVVTPKLGPAGERRVTVRDATDTDLELAAEAETRARGQGLLQLARRCPAVWQVGREGLDDASALLLAAIVASLALGPVVDPHGPDIFGVKTARERLDRLRK